MNYVDFSECSNIINSSLPDNQIPIDTTGSNICAGPITGEAPLCLGDNGGPLIVNNQLVAISTWVYEPCGVKGLPAVFTSIPAYADFIALYVDNV